MKKKKNPVKDRSSSFHRSQFFSTKRAIISSTILHNFLRRIVTFRGIASPDRNAEIPRNFAPVPTLRLSSSPQEYHSLIEGNRAFIVADDRVSRDKPSNHTSTGCRIAGQIKHDKVIRGRLEAERRKPLSIDRTIFSSSSFAWTDGDQFRNLTLQRSPSVRSFFLDRSMRRETIFHVLRWAIRKFQTVLAVERKFFLAKGKRESGFSIGLNFFFFREIEIRRSIRFDFWSGWEGGSLRDSKLLVNFQIETFREFTFSNF